MRKLTGGPFISLDGVVEAPDTLLLGRVTYDSFAGGGFLARERAQQKQSPTGHS